MNPRLDIASWPARLGVQAGDTVQLMADLTRMAWHARRAGQRIDPAALLDAFLQAVGPQGTVVVPTFTFQLADGAAFDVRNTPSISGALAHAALAHPAFWRTGHPLHSFAVAGAGAEELVQSKEPSSFGPASPFAFLQQRSATLIAIDLPLDDALTFVHYVEEREGVPYRRLRRMRFRYTDVTGNTSERSFTLYAKRPGHHMAFGGIRPALERAGALISGEIDGSLYLCVPLAAAYPVIAADIHQNAARGIHRFTWRWWLRDLVKPLLRRLGVKRDAL